MTEEINFVPIEWSEQMATGIDKIDKQHRYLISTLARANSKLLTGHDSTLLSEIAKDLLNYALIHFEAEEDLMKRHGYAEAFPEQAAAHIAQHRTFSHQVVSIRDNLREGRPVSRVAVLKYLNEWLRNHVLGIDQQLGAFVRAAEARLDADQAG